MDYFDHVQSRSALPFVLFEYLLEITKYGSHRFATVIYWFNHGQSREITYLKAYV